MKSFFISLLIMLSFLSSVYAETSCLCMDDVETHVSSEQEHSDEEGSDEDHCSHVCSQCHFVALTTPFYRYSYTDQSFEITYTLKPSTLRSVTELLYRPPIA